MSTQKRVSVWFHWKQGDDLAHYMGLNKGKAVQGLREWADSLERGAKAVREIAGALEGHPVTIDAQAHHIGIDGDPALIEKLQHLDGVNIEEIEDEDKDVDNEAYEMEN